MSTLSTIVSDVIGAGANVATGGLAGVATGILGSITHGILSYFGQKAQATHEESMAELNLKLIAAQTASAQALNADQLKVLTLQGQDAAFVASQQSGAIMAGTSPVIAGIIQLFRPALTVYLLVMEYIHWDSYSVDLKQFIIISHVSLTGMAVAWWYGNRQLEKFIPSKPSV